jgi:hypothetical protein
VCDAKHARRRRRCSPSPEAEGIGTHGAGTQLADSMLESFVLTKESRSLRLWAVGPATVEAKNKANQGEEESVQ